MVLANVQYLTYRYSKVHLNNSRYVDGANLHCVGLSFLIGYKRQVSGGFKEIPQKVQGKLYFILTSDWLIIQIVHIKMLPT